MQPRKSFTDSYYEDPNYAAYNYLPDSFSQANQTQNPEDSFVNARSMYHDNKRNDNMNITSYVQDESMMIYNSQMGSSSQHQQNQYDIDDLDELILDDADIEAEVNEAFEQDQIALSSPQNTDNRPFTPIHEIGNFWPQENNQAEGFPTGLTIIEPFNDAFAYGRQEETDELVHEFDDVLDTISEFDPDRHAPY